MLDSHATANIFAKALGYFLEPNTGIIDYLKTFDLVE